MSFEQEQVGIDPVNPQTRDPSERAGTSPRQWVEALLRAVGAAKVGQKWQCPAHGTEGEHSPSLHLADGAQGRLLIKCHAGCSYRDVLWALSLEPGALTAPPPTPPDRHSAFFLRHLKFPPIKRAD